MEMRKRDGAMPSGTAKRSTAHTDNGHFIQKIRNQIWSAYFMHHMNMSVYAYLSTLLERSRNLPQTAGNRDAKS